MPSHKVDTDKVIHSAGNRGRYQILQGFLCTVSCITCAFPALSFVFIGYIPEHNCAVLPNTTDWGELNIESEFIEDIQYRKCHIDITSNKSGVVSQKQLSCINGYEYNSHRDISIVSEFDLVCDKAGLAELSQTVLLLGQCFGAVIFSSLSDRFGRKTPLLVSYFILLACTVGQAFITNVMSFTSLRFFMGAAQQGIGIGSYSIFIEMMTSDIRIYCGFVDSISWSLSTMSLAPVAYLTRHYSWRVFQYATLISFLHVPFLFSILDESLRWLLANNKYDAAEKVVKRMCVLNKTSFEDAKQTLDNERSKAEKSMEDVPLQYLKHNEVQNESDVKKEVIVKTIDTEIHISNNSKPNDLYTEKDTEMEKSALLVDSTDTPSAVEKENPESNNTDRYTVLDIIKHKDVFKISTIICFIWAVHALTYYGLYLTSSSMSGNRFLNYFLNSLVELPSYLTMFFALNRKGRREVTMLFSFLTGIFLMLSFIFLSTLGGTSAGGILSNLFSLLGKFCVSGSFMVIYIYTPEIYPTNLRNAGLGLASAVGRLGGMVAPYSSLLSEVVAWGPGVVFTACCILASILMYFLPETKGRPLPTTIQEMRELKQVKAVEIIIPDIKE